MEAWPSWEMLLARRTGNGTMPAAYSVTKIRCGPDSGIMPTATANRIIRAVLSLIHELMSMKCISMAMADRTPNVQRKMLRKCFLMT